ncbi:MAG: 16S rRNA (cytidine(1402)-2'-O)-methyltransferase [Ruminococcus sp.]|nr:16S rRNA (cytidine(1402)-2'-O)-methyltransferase [Ruminococcus sp.]
MGTLYVVGTPIGNLDDMTFRGVQTLNGVDFICAEDTRVTAKLLAHFDIKKPLVSYHEHNAHEVGDRITDRLIAGENAAIVTDAGMPCISDPGELLVKLCAQRGIDVKVVPAATAAMSAIAISGLETSNFIFVGFLSVNKRVRQATLANVKDRHETLIFYEAPHKLLNTLQDLLRFLGDRRISVCRELTKLHEETIRICLSQAVELYTENKPKGEFVLVVEGAKDKDLDNTDTIEIALEKVKSLVQNGMRAADACREIAKVSSFSKGDLYSAYLEDDTDE